MKLKPLANVHVDELLHHTVQRGCSELYLRVGHSPETRHCADPSHDKGLGYDAPSTLDVQQMVYAILTDEQIIEFEHSGEVACRYSAAGIGEFAVHLKRPMSFLEAEFIVMPHE